MENFRVGQAAYQRGLESLQRTITPLPDHSLNKYGKEADAIKCAECRYQNHLRSGTSMPSKMCPCTTVHWLVDEIRKKAVHQDKNSIL